MANLTHLSPSAGVPGGLYGTFTGKETASIHGPHNPTPLTHLAFHGGVPQGLYGDFAGKEPSVEPPVVIVDEAPTGTGGIDPGDGLRRIVKPTGLLERSKPKGRVAERLDESREIQAEIAGRLAREFADENAATAIARAAEIQATLTAAEITAEIGMLLRKKLRTQEDELLLLLLMAVAGCQ